MTLLTNLTKEVPTMVEERLATILSWPRAHDSLSEKAFVPWLSAQITVITGQPVTSLAKNCLYVEVKPKRRNKVKPLFSCHIDTVDLPSTNVKKSLTYDPNLGLIGLSNSSSGECLGADDGAGIWLMLEMLKARVPGGYIFHRGEECGGVGSKQVLIEHLDLLEKFSCAVAFDRARDNEVIIAQGGVQCASKTFGNALSEKLTSLGLSYSISDRGSFTDTKVYRGVIPECVNLGVGYSCAHSKGETLDYCHLSAMAAALISLGWETLPIARDPTIVEEIAKPSFWPSNFVSSDFPSNRFASGYNEPRAYPGDVSERLTGELIDELKDSSLADIESWVENYPDQAARAIAGLLLKAGRLESDVKILEGLAGVSDEI